MYFWLILTIFSGVNTNLGVERHQRGVTTPTPRQIEHWLHLNTAVKFTKSNNVQNLKTKYYYIKYLYGCTWQVWFQMADINQNNYKLRDNLAVGISHSTFHMPNTSKTTSDIGRKQFRVVSHSTDRMILLEVQKIIPTYVNMNQQHNRRTNAEFWWKEELQLMRIANQEEIVAIDETI